MKHIPVWIAIASPLLFLTSCFTYGMEGTVDDWVLTEKDMTIHLPPKIAVNALFWAVWSTSTNGKLIIDLIKKYGIPVNQPDEKGRTALHLATMKDNKQIIETLLALGADRAIADNNCNTVFHHAVINDAIGAITLLTTFPQRHLPKPQIHTLRNRSNKSPLELAIELYKQKLEEKKPTEKLHKIIELLALDFAGDLDTKPKKSSFFHNSYDQILPQGKEQQEEKELSDINRSWPQVEHLAQRVHHTRKMLSHLENKEYDDILAWCAQENP